jgi:hypothetical protein
MRDYFALRLSLTFAAEKDSLKDNTTIVEGAGKSSSIEGRFG